MCCLAASNVWLLFKGASWDVKKSKLGLPWKLTKITVTFEIAVKNCILDSLVDYKGCSILSQGFLPMVVDTVVI